MVLARYAHTWDGQNSHTHVLLRNHFGQNKKPWKSGMLKILLIFGGISSVYGIIRY